jgi:hypothetical protein
VPKYENNEAKPDHVIRVGNVELDLWGRENEYGLFYSGRLKRHYTDKSDEAKVTYYLGDRDFNDAISVLSEGIRYTNEKIANYRLQAAILPDAINRESSSRKSPPKSQPKTDARSEPKTPASPTAGSSSPDAKAKNK